MLAGRRHRRRQPKPSTTRVRRRHTNTMRRAHPDHSTMKSMPDRPPSTKPKQQRLNKTGCARTGLPTVHLTQRTASTRRQTTTDNVTQRVVQRPTRAQPTNTKTFITTTRTTSDHTSARCSVEDPTPNKATMLTNYTTLHMDKPRRNSPAPKQTCRLHKQHSALRPPAAARRNPRKPSRP